MKTLILALTIITTANASAAPNRSQSTLGFQAAASAPKKAKQPTKTANTDSTKQVTQIISSSYGLRLF